MRRRRMPAAARSLALTLALFGTLATSPTGAAEPLTWFQIAMVDDKCEAWEAPLYDGPAGGGDSPGIGEDITEIIDSSPDGSTVYTLGYSDGASGAERDSDLVTIATNASD